MSKPYHEPWMDLPIVDLNDYDALQLHCYNGVWSLAIRYKPTEDKLYQKWHVPVKKKRRPEDGKIVEYLGTMKDKQCTAVKLGNNLKEVEATLEFFLTEVRKMIDNESSNV